MYIDVLSIFNNTCEYSYSKVNCVGHFGIAIENTSFSPTDGFINGQIVQVEICCFSMMSGFFHCIRKITLEIGIRNSQITNQYYQLFLQQKHL